MLFAPSRGFTLIEILVVVSIMSIMAGTVIFFAMQSSATGRDADRQADLRALQAAVEAYKRDTGSYPAGCNAAGAWSGEQGTAHACTGGSREYIIGLAPKYIRALPIDPNRNACADTTAPLDCGYAYVTNATRDVYKIIAMNTVESEIVTSAHALKSCANNNINDLDPRISGYCAVLPSAVNNALAINAANVCHVSNSRFQNSYAVWGGFAEVRGTSAYGVNPSGEGCITSTACIDATPNNPQTDLLDSFSNTDGVTTDPTSVQKRNLRVRALKGTTEIICR